MGIVVPKRGHTAVDRNRLKRRLHELVRLHILRMLEPAAMLQPVDVAIYARLEAYDASFVELQVELTEGMRRMIRALQKSERA